MFGFLKEKLKSAIKTIGDKIKKKPVEVVETPKVEKEEVRKKPEVKKEEKKPEKLPEKKEVKEKREKEELKKEVKEEIKEEKEEKPVEKQGEKPAEKTEEKKGFFQKLKELTKVKLNNEDFDDLFEQLEMTLMENNVAMSVIDSIKKELKKELINKPLSRKDIDSEITKALRNAISDVLLGPFDFVERVKSKKPYVITFFGINGSGKTTTIAKIAHLLAKNNLSCVLAASDTFRAASIEQLQKHADKLGIKMIKHQYGSDPAAVAFDAISYAKTHSIDVVLVDTAGRMHTESNLMKEMEKIVRVSKPDMKLFIGEAIVGNDAVEQADSFNKSIGIDGIILSKADVDEKGGASISVSHVTGKPILYFGTGQEYNDLEKFNKDKIIRSLGL